MQVGDKLYLYIDAKNDYYVSIAKTPYTVIRIIDDLVLVQEAKPIFYGEHYYDTLPDDIIADPQGRIQILKYSKARDRWEVYKDTMQVACFGNWEYFPYLN